MIVPVQLTTKMAEFHTRLIDQTVDQIETTNFDHQVLKAMHAADNKFKIDKKGIFKCVDYAIIDGKTYMIGIAKIWQNSKKETNDNPPNP